MKTLILSKRYRIGRMKHTNSMAASGPSVWVKLINQRFLYFLLLPGIAYFVIFHYIPMYGIVLAFKRWVPPLGILGSPWVGLLHFSRILNSSFALTVIRNTFVISVYQIAVGFPAPIILAIMLNELRSTKLKKTVQTISYLPHFLSWVVMSGLVMEILSPSRGLYGYIAELLGFKPEILLMSRRYFRTILVFSGVWKGVGWSSIIYLASIAGIDAELYQASAIDGATRFQNIRYITLPGLAPVITILLILQVSGLLQVGFDPVFNLYNPAVYDVAEVLSTYTYRTGLAQGDFAYSTAIGLANNVIAFFLLIIANKTAKAFSSYGIW